MTNPEEFEACITKPCFIFLSEPPYVLLDRRMETPADSRLFPCGRPKKLFKRLAGSAFEVMAQSDVVIDQDAQCVWGGPTCQFNEMVNIIDFHAKHNPDHRFGATGLLLENKGRLRVNVSQSVSLMQEELTIFGEPSDKREMLPVARLLLPFHYMTWFSFAIFSLLLGFFGVITARVFGPRAPKYSQILQNTFHFYMDPREAVAVSAPHLGLVDSADLTQSECDQVEFERISDRFLSYKVVRLLMRIAVSAMIVIFLLFYEVAVVNYLFIEQSKPKLRDVQQLSKEDLKMYAVEKLAATEQVWHQTTYQVGKYKNNTANYPWKRCKDLKECFDWALDEKNPVKFVVGFKSAGMYQVRNRHACREMTIYETQKKMYSFGAGWLYGNAISSNFTNSLNKDILNMHEDDRLPGIIEAGAGTQRCQATIYDIDVGVVGASIMLLVLPNLALILAMISCFFISVRKFGVADGILRQRSARLRRRKARRADVAIELEGFDDVTRPARAATYDNTESSATLRLEGFERMQSI